jgi:hypothetical protein
MIIHRHEVVSQKQLGLLMGLSFMVCVLTFQSGIYWVRVVCRTCARANPPPPQAAHSNQTNQYTSQTVEGGPTVYYVSDSFNGGAMNSVAVFSFFMWFVEVRILFPVPTLLPLNCVCSW